MSEHLSLERISALLDDGASDRSGESHLDGCAECRVEYERMSRMRMALSAMSEAEPPAGEWKRIERRLEAAGLPARGALLSRAFAGWPLRAAAALVLFGGGIAAGLQLTSPFSADPGVADGRIAGPTGDVREVRGSDGPVGPEIEPGSAYLSAMAELRDLGAPRWAGALELRDGAVDPVAAAERLARLDALIRASRQTLEEAPADPVANDLLFQLVDERNELASRFRESLRLAGMEYR